MASHSAGQNNEAAILARLIQMGKDDFSKDVAEYLLWIYF
jgi:hypothetical protein